MPEEADAPVGSQKPHDVRSPHPVDSEEVGEWHGGLVPKTPLLDGSNGFGCHETSIRGFQLPPVENDSLGTCIVPIVGIVEGSPILLGTAFAISATGLLLTA